MNRDPGSNQHEGEQQQAHENDFVQYRGNRIAFSASHAAARMIVVLWRLAVDSLLEAPITERVTIPKGRTRTDSQFARSSLDAEIRSQSPQ
jgi:hypothetical protein